MKIVAVGGVALLLCSFLVVGGVSGDDAAAQGQVAALDVSALPVQARELVDDLEEVRAQTCPALPLTYLVAEIQTESSWNPHAFSSAGAAGLLQLMPATWSEAGGGNAWSVGTPPPDDHPVWQPRRHFEVALPWMCQNLRTVTQHLQATGKPTSPLDALAVCHIAGCSRVTGSATGIPTAGEAGCGGECVRQVVDYVAAIHHWMDEFTAPASVGAAAPAQAFSEPSGGCTISDPTGTGGCVTPATAWMLQQFTSTFGRRSTSCWDAHAWNPTSDHPQGRGCDIFYGKAGYFPGPGDTALGWQAASWLQSNAAALHLSYLIWQGRIWSVARADEGWRVYTGGGVYDATDPTGGHYDHIHVSVAA